MATVDRAECCGWCWWFEEPPAPTARHGICHKKTDASYTHWVHERHDACREYAEEKPAGLDKPRSDKPWTRRR